MEVCRVPIKEKQILDRAHYQRASHVSEAVAIQLITEILCQEKESGSHMAHSAEAFLEFFEIKAKSVRSSTDGYQQR